MKFLSYRSGGRDGLAVAAGSEFRGVLKGEPGYPGSIEDLLAKGGPSALTEAGKSLKNGKPVDLASVQYRPPLSSPGKIICLGLNYVDHAAEGGFKPPDYPTIFARFTSSLIGHGAPLICPNVSTSFDYEGELVAVIGKGGRHIAKADALGHIAGYSVFNDASVRDYQLRTPQWTIGKNFDGTGAFGPYLVTADELPPGARGLKLRTRLNGQVVQDAVTDDMIFDVATTISILSEALTLAAGDVLVMGTPSGIGLARKPPLFMKAGDVCEVEIDQVGLLRNPVANEEKARAVA